MKKNILILLMMLAFASTPQLYAAPIDVCTSRTSSCGDCKVVKALMCDRCECVVNSRTHFTDHSLYYINSPERESLFQDLLLSRADRRSGVQAVVFGGKTSDRGRMATYFTPFCASELRVKENMDNETKAIGAAYFNVRTLNGDFESIIRFAPEQSVIGLGLSWKQRFAQNDCGRAWLFGISAPIMRVKNTMNFSEEIINDGGGFDPAAPSTVATMQEAFRQSSWECGKINCACDMTKTRLAYLELTLGYEFLNSDTCKVMSYIGTLLPTGNSVKSEFLFEPVVGYGKHTGFMFGTTADLQLWANECEDHALWYHFHANGLYLARKHEQRLIDVVDKPWSRFMRVYKNKAQAQEAVADSDLFLSTPGVNIFCQEVKVKPGFQRSYGNSFIYQRCGFTGELGYVFFNRPAECVELACPWVEESAFIAYAAPVGSTDSVQMINNIFETDGVNRNALPIAQYDDNIITACDLDMQSATHPSVITHTFYGAAGYTFSGECRDYFIGAGGSFEDSPDNTGASRWNVWAKGGLFW